MSATMLKMSPFASSKKKDTSMKLLKTPVSDLKKDDVSSPSYSLSPGCSDHPKSKKLNKAEKLLLRDRARNAMTPKSATVQQGKNENFFADNKEEEPTPQRTPLTLAIAMKAATSPTPSSFPDSFWNLFIEQEEYDRKQMEQMKHEQELRHRGVYHHIDTCSTPRNLQFSPAKEASSHSKANDAIGLEKAPENSAPKINKSFQLWHFFIVMVQKALAFGFHLALVLLLLSTMDVDYFQPYLQILAFVGKLCIGITLALYQILAHQVVPTLKDWIF